MTNLKARTVSITSLSEGMRTRMFDVFRRYYENVEREAFDSDLSTKDAVILLVNPADNVIHGFSTLKNASFVAGGRRVRGVFSGDTVLEREYWGQGALGIAFLTYLFREKAKAPLTPFYWFLISKGYKTYLLMANNFVDHYPQYDGETPAFEQSIMDTFAAQMFGEAYDPERGLVAFKTSHGQLRDGITPITDEDRAYDRIAFFEKRNPTWMEGTELVCTAKMTWLMPVQYAWKVWVEKPRLKARARLAQAASS